MIDRGEALTNKTQTCRYSEVNLCQEKQIATIYYFTHLCNLPLGTVIYNGVE